MKKSLAVAIFLLSMINVAHAERAFTILRDKDWFLEASGDLQFTGSEANQIENATFSQDFSFSQVFHLGLSVKVWRGLLLGVQYGYWSAKQEYTESTNTISDTFVQHSVGPMLGVEWGNPRLQYRFLIVAPYSASLFVERLNPDRQNFLPDSLPINYEARFQINLKFSSSVVWLLQGGFRFMDLGAFKSGSETFPATGNSLNMSGPFVGSGLGIFF
jgi:hypothetical protein